MNPTRVALATVFRLIPITSPAVTNVVHPVKVVLLTKVPVEIAGMAEAVMVLVIVGRAVVEVIFQTSTVAVPVSTKMDQFCTVHEVLAATYTVCPLVRALPGVLKYAETLCEAVPPPVHPTVVRALPVSVQTGLLAVRDESINPVTVCTAVKLLAEPRFGTIVRSRPRVPPVIFSPLASIFTY